MAQTSLVLTCIANTKSECAKSDFIQSELQKWWVYNKANQGGLMTEPLLYWFKSKHLYVLATVYCMCENIIDVH